MDYLTCVLEYQEYVEIHEEKCRTTPGWQTSTTNYAFWTTDGAHLQQMRWIALWWNVLTFSSIACERVFGIARTIDIPNRNRQSWSRFATELKLKVNKVLIEDMTIKKLNAYNLISLKLSV